VPDGENTIRYLLNWLVLVLFGTFALSTGFWVGYYYNNSVAYKDALTKSNNALTVCYYSLQTCLEQRDYVIALEEEVITHCSYEHYVLATLFESETGDYALAD